jgi:hypothetical protein
VGASYASGPWRFFCRDPRKSFRHGGKREKSYSRVASWTSARNFLETGATSFLIPGTTLFAFVFAGMALAAGACANWQRFLPLDYSAYPLRRRQQPVRIEKTLPFNGAPALPR